MTSHRRTRTLRAAALAAAALLPIPHWSRAGTYTWTSTTSGNWSNPANWRSSLAPPLYDPAGVLVFVGSNGAAYTATNDHPDPLTLNTLMLNGAGSGSYTVTGGPLDFAPSSFGFAYVYRAPSSPVATTFTLANPLHIRHGGTLYFNSIATGTLAVTGPISGAGALLAGYNGGPLSFTARSTFTGGARIVATDATVSGDGLLGTGPIIVGADEPHWEKGGRLSLDSAANVAGDRSVSVRPGAFVEFKTLDDNALNRIAGNSGGVLALTPTTTVSPFALDLRHLPTLRIGTNDTRYAGNITLSAEITPAGHTYRFGGQRGDTAFRLFNSDSLTVASPLTDAYGGVPQSVNIGSSRVGSGGHVRISNPANSYSGGTVIERSPDASDFTALAFDYTPAPGQTPLGTGPVTVYGNLVFDGAAGSPGSLPNTFNFMPGSQLHFNNLLSPAAGSYSTTTANRWPDAKPIALNGTEIVRTALNTVEVVGALSFDNGSLITIDTTFGSQSPSSTGIQTPSLTRTNRGTLTLQATSGAVIGTTHVARVTGAAALKHPATGMIPPYVVARAGASADFVTADANGYLAPITYTSAFNAASDTEVLSHTTTATLSTDETVHALKKSAGTLTIAAGRTLSVRSGGLIGASAIAGPGTLAFVDNGAPVEALIFAHGSSTFTISASITAAAGLTKFGPSPLLLSGTNNIAGPVNVHAGTLTVASPASLDTSTVPVHLDYRATLTFQGYNPTLRQLTGTGTLAATITGATQTVTFDTGAADSTFAGMLSGWNTTPLAVTKTGSGTLTLSGFNRYNGPTTVAQGTLTLSGTNDIPHSPTDPLVTAYANYSTAAGAHLQFLAPHRIANLTGDGSTTVGPHTSLVADRIQQHALTIGVASTVTLAHDNPTVPVQLATLTLDESSALDLRRSDLVVSSTPPEVLRDHLRYGRLISSVFPATSTDPRLGYITISGVTRVSPALPGDANLDGDITPDDWALIDRGFATAGRFWSDGDFDYDGAVTPADYFLADQVVALRHTLGPELLALRESQFGPQYVSQLLTSIPEPSSLSSILYSLSSLSLLRRRRKREWNCWSNAL